MLSDEWLPRYRLLENINIKWNGNGNGNAYDRGDYNSSFALRAVELKSCARKKTMLLYQMSYFDIDINMLLFKNPSQDKLSPATPSQAQLCIRYTR